MFTRRLKSFAAAAGLTLTLAFAYQSFAGAGPSPNFAAPAGRASGGGPVIHGKGVARFGGYELNIAFTPGGRLLCLDLSPTSALAPTPKG